MHNISLVDIQNLNFERFRETISDSESYEIAEFFGDCGKEHYRLLSYLSTLFNNTTIIEIGTHKGKSSLALSYNETNTIHTFDIVELVTNTKIKSTTNIQFHIENLFEKDIQDKWVEVILKSPFIFLDVDPHNGHMEFELYQYLEKINYPGFVVCDDIWYFKEMRDNFWYKIPDEVKYDLTDFGHFSGTGIFSFNKEISFFKRDNSNWTLVSAYFNLTKCSDASESILKRDATYYLNSSISTLSLPYYLVVYCDKESYEEIQKIRPAYLKNKTKYIITEFDNFKFKNKKDSSLTFKDYRNIIINNRINKPYHFDNRNTASYYLFCMSRYIMLKEVIEMNPFGSTHFSWINFCIERMGYKNLIRLDEALSVNRDKFSTCYIDYIPEMLIQDTNEYFKYGRCSMCSGFFTGNSYYMYKVCDLIEDKFLEYLEKGYGHADEQLFSPVYFQNCELFEHYYGDYQQMITNYVFIYDAPEPPIYNFIKNSFENKNYKKCYEACKYVWESHMLKKCNVSENYLQNLQYYYTNSILLYK